MWPFTSLCPVRTSSSGKSGTLHLLSALLVLAIGGTARVRAEVSYRARGGESVWLIARTQGAPVHTLIAGSKLSLAQLRSLPAGAILDLPGDQLKDVPEATLVLERQNAMIAGLPADSRGGTYLLGLGETLWDVALRFGLSFGRLIEANQFQEEQLWILGFETPILLPGIPQARVEQPGTRVPNGTLYRLNAGETLWDVASRYQVGLSELMAVNGMDQAAVRALRAGARVFVPQQRPDGHVGPASSTAGGRPRRLARLLGLGTRPAAAALYHGHVKQAWQRLVPAANQFSGTLLWPVARGHFVRGYGSGPGGYHLAIDIGGEIGAKVRAAAPGVVAYAGHALRGYGNLLLLIHPGGLITMYAHNSALHVAAGVDVGDVIAEVGSSGLSRGPHVHFELMHAGMNCDPTSLLRPGIRRINGEIDTPDSALRWQPPGRRPTQVACARRRHYPKEEAQLDDEASP